MADNVVGSIVARIRADATQMVATFARAKQQAGGFTKSLETIGGGFTKAAALTAGFGIAIGAITKVTGDFEQTMANVGAVTGAVGDDMNALSTIAIQMGKSTIFSASEAGKAMFNLGSAGIKTASDFKNILKPALDLAAAAQADISFVTETVIGNVRAFGLETTDAARVANIFSAANENSALTAQRLADSLRPVAPLAGSMGISIENVSAALGTLANRNIKAQEAGTGLRNVFIRLSKPVGRAKVILDKAGLTAEKLGELMKDPVKLIRRLGEESFTTAEGIEIFGARAVGTFRALEGGVDDMEALRESITGTDSASRIATRQLDTFNSQVKLMKSALEALVITIGNNLLPTFRKWVEGFTEVIGKAIKFVEVHGELVKDLILGSGKFLIITTSALGFLAVLAKLIIMGPKIAGALATITTTVPWAALAVAISFATIKLLGFAEAAVDARNEAATFNNTSAGLAKRARELAGKIEILTNRNFSLSAAYERVAQTGFFINKNWMEQQLTVKQLIQLAKIQEQQAVEAEEKKKARAAAEKVRKDLELEEETVRQAAQVEMARQTNQALIDAEDLRVLNTADNFLGLSAAGTDFFESIIKDSDSASEAFANFAKTIKATFIRAIAGMIARAITFLAIIATLKLLGVNLGGGGAGALGRKFITGFAAGGVIGAQGGLLPPGEDTLVAAQTGEAILTRQGVSDIGGPEVIEEINSGRGGGVGGDSFTFNMSQLGGPTQDDIDFIRKAVQEGKRQSAGEF